MRAMLQPDAIAAIKPGKEQDSSSAKELDVAGNHADPVDQAKFANDPALPREVGGRDGPEPTRFGDWEKSGRCIDF